MRFGPHQFVVFVFDLHHFAQGACAGPAVLHQQVHVVLHDLGPVVHEVLVHVIRVHQGHGLEAGQQIFGQGVDKRLGMVALFYALHGGQVARLPCGKAAGGLRVKGHKFGVGQRGGFHLGHGLLQLGIAFAQGLEQQVAQAGHHFPIGGQCVQVAVGDAARHVGLQVLNVFGLCAVDVARQVEVVGVFVAGNFIQRHHAGVACNVFELVKRIHNFVNVLFAQFVFVAVFDEAFAGVDHHHAFASVGVLLVEHQHAGRNARAIKQVGWQADDALENARSDELFTNHRLGIAPEQHPVRQDAGGFAGAVHAANDVHEVGVVALLGWRHAPAKALVRVALPAVAQRQAGAPLFVTERWVGHHVVVGAQLFAVFELGCCERVAAQHVGRGEVVQDHVHAGQARCGHVFFLAFEGDGLACFGGHFEQQRARPTGGVVCGGFGAGVVGANAQHFGQNAADFAGGVELAFAFTRVLRKVAHEELIRIAQDVVVVGAVLREVQLRLLKDGNQVAQPLNHFLAFAQFVGVVEVRKVAAGQLAVGVNQRLDDLGIDLVANVALALQVDHVLEAGPFGDDHRRGKVVAVGVFIAHVFDEQHEQHIVFVLAGIHAPAQCVARGPEGGIQVGFFDGHGLIFRGQRSFTEHR